MEDQRNVAIFSKKKQSKPIILICIYLLLILSGESSSSDSPVQVIDRNSKVVVTENETLVLFSKRGNGAISEALKKDDVRKGDSKLKNDELGKPFTYINSESKIQSNKKRDEVYPYPLDNDIHESKPSSNLDVVTTNGNVFITTSKSQFEIETKPCTTTFNNDPGIDLESEITTISSSISVDLLTEYPYRVNEETSWSTPYNATISTDQSNQTTFSEFQVNQTEVSSTKSSDFLSTITETITTTTQEESAITFITKDQSGMNTTMILEPSSIVLTTISIPKVLNSELRTISEGIHASISSTTVSKTVVTKPMISTANSSEASTIILATPMTTITLATPGATMKPSMTTTITTTITKPTLVAVPTEIVLKPRIITKKIAPVLRIVTPKTISTSSGTYFSTWQEEGSQSTTDSIFPKRSTENITLFIRIIFEGSWYDVCSKLSILRQSLTELVNNNANKTISSKQIIFHQTRCADNLIPVSLVSQVPLTSILVYIVDENGNFNGTLTKVVPSLYKITPINFPLPIQSFQLVSEANSDNAIAVIIVSCIMFICFILLAGLLFLMRKRQSRFNYGERCRPVSLDAYSLDSVSAFNSMRRSKSALRCSKRSYGNPTFEDSNLIPTHLLNFANLETFYNDVTAIDEEFANIPHVSSKIDELPPGAEVKNRYANVIPLPETRVPLLRLNNDPLSEYINASYVWGPKNTSKYYIACQAPTDNTVPDFWRMIWEQQCKVIIMLTDLVENGAEKCSEYIPPLEISDCNRQYGDYQVTLKKREAKEKYAISTLHVKNLEKNTFREVWHIWYLWPPNGIPTDAAGLIAVLLEARALQRNSTGPIVMHCSPGTGRTGSLIALDLGIRQFETTRTVDVPRTVYSIRRNRAGAVQTKEQYSFIYKALHLYTSKLVEGAIEST